MYKGMPCKVVFGALVGLVFFMKSLQMDVELYTCLFVPLGVLLWSDMFVLKSLARMIWWLGCWFLRFQI